MRDQSLFEQPMDFTNGWYVVFTVGFSILPSYGAKIALAVLLLAILGRRHFYNTTGASEALLRSSTRNEFWLCLAAEFDWRQDFWIEQIWARHHWPKAMFGSLEEGGVFFFAIVWRFVGQKVKWPTTKRCKQFSGNDMTRFCFPYSELMVKNWKLTTGDTKPQTLPSLPHTRYHFAFVSPERGLIRISRILWGIHGTVFESRPNHSKLTPTKIRADANFFCAGFALAGVWKYLCVFRRQLRIVEVFFKGSLRACYRTLVFQRSVWKQFGEVWPCSFQRTLQLSRATDC